MKENDELIVLSSIGVFVYEDVNMDSYKKLKLRED